MKYAIIDKGNGWRWLVGLPDMATRADQWIRYGYEYPDGTWADVSYLEARRCGFDMRHWRDGRTLTIEMCDGKAYPAIATNKAYLRMKLAGIGGTEEEDFTW